MPLVREEVWSDTCPSCSAVNYYQGDVSDYVGLNCWKCGHDFLFELVEPDDLIGDDPTYLEGEKSIRR